MFLFPQIKHLPDSSRTFNSPHGSFIFSNCNRRHLLGPFLLQNGILQPKEGLGRRGKDVWMIRNGKTEEVRNKDALVKKRVRAGEPLKRGFEEGRAMARRRKSRKKKWREPVFAGTGLRAALRLCSLWLWLHFCVVCDLFET